VLSERSAENSGLTLTKVNPESVISHDENVSTVLDRTQRGPGPSWGGLVLRCGRVAPAPGPPVTQTGSSARVMGGRRTVKPAASRSESCSARYRLAMPMARLAGNAAKIALRLVTRPFASARRLGPSTHQRSLPPTWPNWPHRRPGPSPPGGWTPWRLEHLGGRPSSGTTRTKMPSVLD